MTTTDGNIHASGSLVPDATKWTLEEWKEWCLDLAKSGRCPWCGEVLQRTPLASGTWYFSSCKWSDDYFGLQGAIDDASKAAFSRWHNDGVLTGYEVEYLNGNNDTQKHKIKEKME